MRRRVSDLLKSAEFKIILIAVLIRLFGLASPYISDESIWSETVKYMHRGNFDPMLLDPTTAMSVLGGYLGIPHPPLGITLYFVSTSIFGVSMAAMRLVPLIAGIGVMCVTYLLSKRMYDRKTAVITLILMAFSFYSAWSSLYVDIDGSILLFFVTSAIYCYFRFRESKGDSALWLRLSAVSLGVALLTKYTAVLFVPIILLAEFLDYASSKDKGMRKIAERVYPVAYILIISLLIFSIFPAFSYLTGKWGAFLHTFSYGRDTLLTDTIQTQVHTFGSIAVSFAKNIFFILQYATPLIPVLAFFSLRNRSGNEKLLFSWIAVFAIVYTFLIPGGGKVRYIMILIPPLYILAARGISNLTELKKKDAGYIALMSATFLGVIATLNLYGTMKTFNFNNLSIQTIAENGFLWYSGHGSSVFAIHIHSFIFVVVLSALLFAASLKQRYFRNAMLALLALSIAFNSFILFESFNPNVGPDYKETLQLITADYNATEGPMYGIMQFRNAQNAYFGVDRLDFFVPGVHGKVIVIDAELIDNPLFQSMLGQFIDKDCILEKIYYSNNYPFGYVYNCLTANML